MIMSMNNILHDLTEDPETCSIPLFMAAWTSQSRIAIIYELSSRPRYVNLRGLVYPTDRNVEQITLCNMQGRVYIRVDSCLETSHSEWRGSVSAATRNRLFLYLYANFLRVPLFRGNVCPKKIHRSRRYNHFHCVTGKKWDFVTLKRFYWNS